MDPCHLKRDGIGDEEVPRDVGDDDGVGHADGVQVVTGRVALFGEQRVVITPTPDPSPVVDRQRGEGRLQVGEVPDIG